MPPVDSLPGLPTDYTSKFFLNDVVTKLVDPTYRGIILRAWAAEEDFPPLPEGHTLHPLERPLKRGEVGVESSGRQHSRGIVPESSLVLVQRDFIKGATVKRSLTSIEAAVVIDQKVEVRLRDALSDEKISGWVPREKLVHAYRLDVGDTVVYNNWIGTVEDTVDESLIMDRKSSGRNIADSQNHLRAPNGDLVPGQSIEEMMRRTREIAEDQPICQCPRNHADEVILDVWPVGALLSWNAINQRLTPEEQAKYPMPARIWSGEDLKRLARWSVHDTTTTRINSIVRFRSEAEEAAHGVVPTHWTYAGKSYTVRNLKVSEVRSRLKLRWHDGSITEDWANEMVPYIDLDEHEAFPGDNLVWRTDEGESRSACVQNFDARQRVVDLLLLDSKETVKVPVFELDPGGGPDSMQYGVAYGENVLLCADNGVPPPRVPVLGQFDPIDPAWDIELLVSEVNDSDPPLQAVAPEGRTADIDWWGTVVDLNLDGTVEVELANGKRQTCAMKELHVFARANALPGDEGFEDEDPEEAEWEDMDEDDDVDDLDVIGEGDSAMLTGPVDVHDILLDERSAEDSANAWDETMEGSEMDSSAQDAEEVDMEAGQHDETVREDRDGDAMQVTEPEGVDTTPVAGPSTRAGQKDVAGAAGLSDDEHWVSFEILEEAPLDHHYISEPSGNAGLRAFQTRLNKEHKALRTSLPDNILVRTYENRLDLMRCLIIGPEGTPYADAPFVFDIYLDPFHFPNDPPKVHFFSHTNGHGRCNPNLYEEGKVCLSILGTWAGDRAESWSAQRSSLLQVLVSISGLVLVKQPYHCEPAFAKLEGTKEGRINSRLYSEKAYVLSRSFVRTALLRPPTGFDSEVRHYYLANGKLRSVIAHASKLIEEGEAAASSSKGTNEEALAEADEGQMWNADAVGSLTMGAIITLKRTITALEKIAEERGSG